MMKANKNYKSNVATKEMANKKKQELQKSESDTWMTQMDEFEKFLIEATKKEKPFDFLVSMHKKLVTDGDILTDNMVNALRKCMKQQKEWEEKKNDKKDVPLKKITLKVKPFIMKKHNLDSRIITGVVKAESAKAWLIEGHADMLENASFCVRCMKELTEPASQVTGMGKICATKAGIPYDPTGVLQKSKKQRQAIRKQYIQHLHNQKFESWIPKSQAEVIELA